MLQRELALLIQVHPRVVITQTQRRPLAGVEGCGGLDVVEQPRSSAEDAEVAWRLRSAAGCADGRLPL